MEADNNCKKKHKHFTSNFYVPPPARKSENVPRLVLNDHRSKDRLADKSKIENESKKICNNSSLLFKSKESESHHGYTISSLIQKKRKRKKNKNSKSEFNSENGENPVIQNMTLNTDCNEPCVTQDSGNLFHSLVSPSMGIIDIESDNGLSGINTIAEKEQSLSEQSNSSSDNVSNEMVDHKLNINAIVSPIDNSNENFLCELTNHLDINESIERILVVNDTRRSSIENNTDTNEIYEPKESRKNYEKGSKSATYVEETLCMMSDDLLTKPPQSSFIDEVNSEFNDDWEKLLEEDNLQNIIPKSPIAGKITIMKKSNGCTEEKESSAEKDANDSSVIEIYGFPEEFKTQDIYASFSPYVNRGFQLKWVDNTHALGIFPSPLIADEVLNSCLPFVKTRPICQASPLSKEKAKNLILPSTSRPKTCSALARRLVSGALGVRAVFTQAEIQAEKQMLKEAREQRRLAAKQRDAAWEGKF